MIHRLLSRLACILEMHDYRTIACGHGHLNCGLTKQKCTRCGAIR